MQKIAGLYILKKVLSFFEQSSNALYLINYSDTIFLLLVSFSNIWHCCQSLIFKITKMLFIVSIKLYLFLLSQKYLCQTSDFFIQNRNFISFNVFIASDLLLKDRNKFSKKSHSFRPVQNRVLKFRLSCLCFWQSWQLEWGENVSLFPNFCIMDKCLE